ncbi:hypothetical protein BDW69DRAFT_182448 [Aspergillus filifer]
MSTLLEQISDEQHWKLSATANKVHFKNIFQLQNAKSTSRITEQQYLALRPLWKFHEAEGFNSEEWSITGIEEAENHTSKIPVWDAYLDAVVSQTSSMSKLLPITKPLFNFTSLWYMQQTLQQLEGNNENSDLEDVVFVETPLIKKLRERKQGRQDIPQDQPQTPTRPRPGKLLKPLMKLSIKDSPVLAPKKNLKSLLKKAAASGSLDVSITTPIATKPTSPSSSYYAPSPATNPGEPDTDWRPS